MYWSFFLFDVPMSAPSKHRVCFKADDHLKLEYKYKSITASLDSILPGVLCFLV